MAAYDNTYSRVVLWLKVILPLLALAGLSTLFLVSRTIDPAQTVPYADIDIDALTDEQRIGGPTFSGVLPGGAAFSLAADRAWPDIGNPGNLTGETIRATIDLTDGTGISVRADRATFSNADRTAGLEGGILVQTSSGYRMQADRLNMAFDGLRLWSDAPITAEGPGLRITAGKFDITGDGSVAKPHVLVFKGKVSLLYEFEQ